MDDNPYQPPTSTSIRKTEKFKLCSTGIGLSLVGVSVLIPATYIFGSVFFGRFFSQASTYILITIAVAIFYIINIKICRNSEG
jgi:hypothetical protein